MSIKFRGGRRVQRGKGIGGLLRVISGFFKPIVNRIGSSFVKSVKSDTGKAIGNAIKEQSINSALNLTAEALRGNDLRESLANEVASSRETIANALEQSNIGRKIYKKRKNPPPNNKIKRKKISVKIKNPEKGYRSYERKKSKRDPFQ